MGSNGPGWGAADPADPRPGQHHPCRSTLHQLRHSALTHLGEKGVSAILLQVKSRHQDPRTLAQHANLALSGSGADGRVRPTSSSSTVSIPRPPITGMMRREVASLATRRSAQCLDQGCCGGRSCSTLNGPVAIGWQERRWCRCKTGSFRVRRDQGPWP